jgi:DNA-binding CsgD family transcriptional regulator
MTPELERLLSAMVAAGNDDGPVLEAYTGFLRACGLDHYTLGFASIQEDGPSAVEIWTSMSDDWMEEYYGLDHPPHDYVVHRVADLGSDGAVTSFDWGEATAERPEVTSRTGQVLRGAADAGLADAVSFAGKSRGREGDERVFAATFGCARAGRAEVIRRIDARRNELLIAAFAMQPLLRPGLERRLAGIDKGLTAREAEVLGRFAQGLRPDRIADRIGISKRTVDMHAVNARRKLNAQTMAEATAKAILYGLI